MQSKLAQPTKMNYFKYLILFTISLSGISLIGQTEIVKAQKIPKTGVFIRFKIIEPTIGEKSRVSVGGFRHDGDPWSFPEIPVEITKNKWSEWVDLSQWKWHGRVDRAGGIAEWNSIKLSAVNLNPKGAIKNVSFAVELADAPAEKSIVVSFAEKSESAAVVFLAPYPLRENAKEFETGSQMTARHTKWAKAAAGGKPVILKKFEFITSIWGHYDPNLERREISNLKMLGFNVIGGIKPEIARQSATRTYDHTWLYEPVPESVAGQWKTVADNILTKEKLTEDGKWKYETLNHWVVSDEVSGLDFRNVEPAKLNKWFQDYLKSKNVTSEDLGKPIDEIEYPAKAMFEPFLPANESLQNRKLLYYAAKFGQWWSAKQLKQIGGLVQTTLPGIKTETLLPSHGFFGNAWGPANIGMSYRMLDIFEVGAQQSVSQLSAEDWLGLNHMYGSDYTWTGGQTFGYFNALLRSSIGEKPLELRGLITPSDDKYLQLKAHSSLGQGAKSFFFWTFGPTYIGTENYWSDLQSEYNGIARLSRTLQKSEDIISTAKTITDPVAIVYSVSHDIWNTNNHTAFVEKRLLWHALKHLQIQPNFLREEDIEAGKLRDYKVLYLTDWLVSRKAAAQIDEWIKNGGVLYLSAGAATRDEFNEPYSPKFAEAVWGENAAQRLVSEQHAYNERKDLPTLKPLTIVNVNLDQKSFSLPALGARLDLKEIAVPFAKFVDGKTAGAKISYGKGQIFAVGFMPMLAYGQLAGFKPATLEEKWTSEPRMIIKTALAGAKIIPATESSVPVVETDLLTGANGSALILANYTYQPIAALNVDVKVTKPFKQIVSTEGVRVKYSKLPDGRIRVTLPLKWTDIILFK